MFELTDLAAPAYPAVIVALARTRIRELPGGIMLVNGPIARMHPTCAAAVHARVLQVLPQADRDWTCSWCGRLIDGTLRN